VYVIVENVYLQWLCTVPSFTVTSDVDEICWSKWLESMRKDVECTFGILKGRWRILKSGIQIQGVDAVYNIWLTCCVMNQVASKKANKPDAKMIGENKRAWVRTQWLGGRAVLPPHLWRIHN
jgi:hypothetical protein